MAQSRQIDRHMDRQTELDAYESTVVYAQVGPKMIASHDIKFNVTVANLGDIIYIYMYNT